MACLKNIFLLVALLFANNEITRAFDCFSDNMENGSSSILVNDCPDNFNSRFRFKTYDDVPSNPTSSNYYMTTGILENNCGMSEVMYANYGNTVEVHYYTSNNGTGIPRCNINYFGSASGGLSIDVTDVNRWRTATLTILNEGFIQISLDCGYLGANQFIAVSNIFIAANIEERCPVLVTPSTTPPNTTTTPETTTRTTTIDFTTDGTTTTCHCTC